MSSTTDPFTHMEEAWKLEANPFPPEGIRRSADEPFSKDVFPEETLDFKRKLIRGAILGGRAVGFLWSQGVRADTGFGKTTLMLATSAEINEDLGATVLEASGMRKERLLPIAGTYTNLNSLDATGLYPVLFNAAIDGATPPAHGKSLFEMARDRIVKAVGGGSEDVHAAVMSARLRMAPSGAPLRPELVTAFATDGGDGVLRQMSAVTQTARIRNGLQYLDFLMTVLAAADVDHLFIFVDQLEDLATNKSITSAKRSREIGRIRDLLEKEPYASRLHFVFTFHNTAAKILERYWEVNRLPRFEVAPDNTASVVVLRGLSTDDQVAELMRVYLGDKRLDSVDDDLLPFDPDSLSVLRQVSDGRVGILLSRAHELLNAAAEAGRPRISAEFATRYFQGAVDSTAIPPAEDEGVVSTDIDDVLLG